MGNMGRMEPDELKDLEDKLGRLRQKKEEALELGQYERVAMIRDAILDLEARLRASKRAP